MLDNWYLYSAEDVLKKLDVDKSGLANEEVKNNQAKYGLNVLPKKKRDTVFKLILKSIYRISIPF